MIFPEWLYTVDIFFGLFVLFCMIIGLRKGLSGELAHVLTLAFLLVGFLFFYPHLSDVAARSWRGLPPVAIHVAVSIGLLLAGFLFFMLSRLVLKRVMKSTIGETADRLSGIGLGFLRGVVTGLVIMAALSLIPSQRLYILLSEKSSIGSWVCSTLTPWLYPRMMELPVFDGDDSETPEPVPYSGA